MFIFHMCLSRYHFGQQTSASMSRTSVHANLDVLTQGFSKEAEALKYLVYASAQLVCLFYFILSIYQPSNYIITVTYVETVTYKHSQLIN